MASGHSIRHQTEILVNRRCYSRGLIYGISDEIVADNHRPGLERLASIGTMIGVAVMPNPDMTPGQVLIYRLKRNNWRPRKPVGAWENDKEMLLPAVER